jgi:hypothetical protein
MRHQGWDGGTVDDLLDRGEVVTSFLGDEIFLFVLAITGGVSA